MKKVKLGIIVLALSVLLSACGFLDGITGASKSKEEGMEGKEATEELKD